MSKKQEKEKSLSIKDLFGEKRGRMRHRIELLEKFDKQLALLEAEIENPPEEDPMLLKKVKEDLGLPNLNEFKICELTVQERFLVISAMQAFFDLSSLGESITKRHKEKGAKCAGDCVSDVDRDAIFLLKEYLLFLKRQRVFTLICTYMSGVFVI